MKNCEKRTYRVGFDLGGTKMMAIAFDGDSREVGRERKKTKAHEGPAACLDRVVKTIETAIAAGGVAKERLECIGVGCPGLTDLDRGVILNAPNLGWENIALKKTLENAFDCNVLITNDVDAGLYGEYTQGAAKEARCVFGIFPGTGVGGACVYEGKLIRGKSNSCMEIGHIPVLPDGPLCGCGRRGCLEVMASRLAVSAAATAAAYRGDAPNLLKLAGMDLSNIRSRMLADAISAGDKVIETIVRDSAKWLGRGIATAVNMLAPDIVVIGGGLVEALPDFYREEAEKSARSFVMPAFKDSFKVVRARLGDDSVAVGAAAFAHDALKED